MRESWLRSGRVAEDVRVSEGGGTVLLWRRTWHRGASGRDVLPPRVDRRAIRAGARVVPYPDAIGACGGRVDVVPEELGYEVVLTRCSRVARRSSVDFRERPRRTGPRRSGCLH